MAIVNPNTTSNTDTLRFFQPVQTTLIPVANPTTVPHLLEVAERMMSETGGRMIVLSVVTDDPADDLKNAAVRSILDAYTLDESRFSAQLVTHVAANIVDGIIDATHKYRADKILLGLSYAVRGQVELGSIAETVAQLPSYSPDYVKSLFTIYLHELATASTDPILPV